MTYRNKFPERNVCIRNVQNVVFVSYLYQSLVVLVSLERTEKASMGYSKTMLVLKKHFLLFSDYK